MVASYINITPIAKKYKGKWVALDKSFKKVLEFGKTADEVHSKVRQKGIENDTYLYRILNKPITSASF